VERWVVGEAAPVVAASGSIKLLGITGTAAPIQYSVVVQIQTMSGSVAVTTPGCTVEVLE